ncbi:tRNA/rRNA methyltransferase [Shewanella sp. NIFS-20-20]|uniref:tRNA/rRNA methyltransferase n=1 Tax=Shewanella sp. NIFS-20-20 TaxID=2853806 RepID=UPI001C44EFC4|nr:tRNA/rRNA methyltransferase [Shewanella sp. NIFS-20-20]MBV7316355.1 tRNA/rRNA methyltransferase [Shewanella sp. NIFS-20-20]
MNLTIVLVEPARATNIGAAARAIKTMGFTRLVIVNSEQHLAPEAQWLAHGATDILTRIETAPTLAALRPQFDLMVATTARERGQSRTYVTPEQLAEELQHSSAMDVALVFGRESSGLTNQELQICDRYSYVPLANDYPSLNLAQAVMVYSYALSQVSRTIGLQSSPASQGSIQALKNKGELLLDKLNVTTQDKLHRWWLEHLTSLDQRDVNMTHQLLNDVLKKIDKD